MATKKNTVKKPAEKAKAPKKPDTKIIEEHTERLFVPLTPEEYDQRAQQLAQVQYDLQEHYAEEDAQKKALKAKESKLEERRAELSASVRMRKELRDVTVHGVAFYSEGVYREVRMDSGEVVNERRLRAEERQDALPLKPPSRPDAGPKNLTSDEQKKKEHERLEAQADQLLANAGFTEPNADEPPSDDIPF